MINMWQHNEIWNIFTENNSEAPCGSYFEVVKDVTDERDVAHPLLQWACPGLLAALELLLESVQQVSPKDVSIALLGFGLQDASQERRRERELDNRGWGMGKKSGNTVV